MEYLQRRDKSTLLLNVYVQPRSSANKIAGLHGSSLKLRLTSPPVDNKANQALVSFLAKLLHLPKSAIILKSGNQSRHKQLELSGCDEKSVRHILEKEWKR